ncbi:LysR family transcriptional regulator [Nitrospirillum amazonense]|uniref:LysR family transcriptional regulator n=1 Tax=Nitrospirillum amazonense TaxID=28077 RepID=UPI0024124B6C|nr:LysR family transcriptional regulator [Nitrospirillum amazonense]MDG3439094.1 LysR family transcriptional regulator [Nitrospirillum amazonense]
MTSGKTPLETSTLEWDDLRLFLAIARAGTLSAAAPRLNLTQPTAGRRLKALEGRLGVTLFQRTPGGFRLTDDGEVMLQYADRVEAEVLALERRLVGEGRTLEGLLRLSSSEWFGRRILAPALAGFSLQHPKVTVELVVDSRLFDLNRRDADLLFRFLPFDGPDIVQRRFMTVPYALYAAPVYLERRGMPTASGGGADHCLIAMDSQLSTQADVAWLRRHFPEAGFTLRSNSRDVQVAACEGGAGLAVLPRAVADGRGLVEVDIGEEPPAREVWLGYHRDLRRLARLRALLDHLDRAVAIAGG